MKGRHQAPHVRSELGSALIMAGRAERPKAAALARTIAAVGVGAAVAGSAGSAAASTAVASNAGAALLAKVGAKSTLLLVVAKWTGIGVLGGVVTLTASTELSKPRAPVVDTAVVEVATSKDAPVRRRGPPPSAEVPSPETIDESVDEPTTRVEPLPGAVKSTPRARWEDEGTQNSLESSMPEPRPAPPALNPQPVEPVAPPASEIALVDRAWRIIQGGEYSLGLAVLASYEREFPSPSLYPEVLFMRMQAAQRLGDAKGAEAVARHIVSAFPKSAQAVRAGALLAKSQGAYRSSK
ncbi:MAG TPA: hypothetical protein VJT73_07950 [Polyangiaceae bacterium]|nr:hypothetical protein [Polyangiaceae bacterium]